MTLLSVFGLFAVTLMLVAYALEHRSPWFVLLFAAACALGSVYGFAQGAWPFGVVEAVWTVVALRRWRNAMRPVKSDVVRSDPDILSGTPVFVGTRVPVQSLFDYLKAGDNLDEFLRQFPSVTREQAIAALGLARDALLNSTRPA